MTNTTGRRANDSVVCLEPVTMGSADERLARTDAWSNRVPTGAIGQAGGSVLIQGPDTRVIEFRVPGILGTTPENLLDAVAAVDVAGDGAGRIVRPADRLRRPAPGPVLKADGRPLPRTLEGYVWSGLTSGGWAKAVWALLFPFSLANVSSWMLPPVPDGSRVAAALGACCRALVRLAGVLLTVLLVTQLATVSLDLLATQCLAPGRACLTGVVPDGLRRTASVRPVIGVLPLLLVVLVLGRVSSVRWRADVGVDRPDGLGRRLAGLPGAGPIADPDAPALRTLHLTAALATIALVGLGGPNGPVGGGPAGVTWTVAAALLVGSLLVTVALGDPTGVRSGAWVRSALSPVPRVLLLCLATLTVAAVPAVLPRPGASPPGAGSTSTVVIEALAGTCVLLGVLLVPAALVARSRWAGLPVELRPWAGGLLAAPFLALAVLLGAGFGAVVDVVGRAVLGGHALVLPHLDAFLTPVWGAAGVVAVVVTGGVLLVNGVRRLLFGVRVPEELSLLHSERPADAVTAAPAWRAAAWERGHAHHVLLALTGVLVAGAAVSSVPWARGEPPPSWSQPLSGVGFAALVVTAGALLRVVYTAVRKPGSARGLGGLVDLVSFWPREAHPVVPPCHALKAVPEIAARTAGYLADPDTRVVLTGHDQGSAIVVAAATRLLAELPPDQAQRLGVVVAGAPLQWAYPRAFPAVVPHDGLLELCHDLNGRWRSMSRGTDPIGGGLTTWRRQVFDGQLIGVGFRTDGTSGALPPAVAGPTGALVLGGDHWLPDPERGPFVGRRCAAGVLRHDDYYSDPEWDRAVACAAGLESPTEVHVERDGVFRLPGLGSAAG
jgi:hypothetical protein